MMDKKRVSLLFLVSFFSLSSLGNEQFHYDYKCTYSDEKGKNQTLLLDDAYGHRPTVAKLKNNQLEDVRTCLKAGIYSTSAHFMCQRNLNHEETSNSWRVHLDKGGIKGTFFIDQNGSTLLEAELYCQRV